MLYEVITQLTRSAASGRVEGSALAGITTQQRYNGFGELSEYTAAYGGSPLYHYQLERDAAGRIIGKGEVWAGESHHYDYRYDEADRLIRNNFV